MSDALDEKARLLNECRTIAENSLYNAQAHYIISERDSKLKWVFLVIPSFFSGISNALVAIGLPSCIGVLGAIFGGIAGSAAYLGIDRDAVLHMNSGHIMTALRHEARQLHETFGADLDIATLRAEVQKLADKYCTVRLAMPMTTEDAFRKARIKIKRGDFDSDFKDAPSAGLK